MSTTSVSRRWCQREIHAQVPRESASIKWVKSIIKKAKTLKSTVINKDTFKEFKRMSTRS